MRIIFSNIEDKEIVAKVMAATKDIAAEHEINRLVTGDTDVEVEGDFEGAFCQMSSLLDGIEKVLPEDPERAYKMVKGRFAMIESCGFQVEFTGMPTGDGEN